MKITSAKKLSRMSPEEMLDEALQSPQGSEKVAQYLRAAGQWQGTPQVWAGMLENPQTFSSKTVMKTFLDYLYLRVPDDESISMLNSLMDFPPEYMESYSSDLTRLLYKSNTPDFAAVMLLGRATPGNITMDIAKNWGMHQRATHNEVVKREAILIKVMELINSGIPFRNEITGALFGSLFKTNSQDPLAKTISETATDLPRSFVQAAFENGDEETKQKITGRLALMSKNIDDVIGYYSKADSHDRKMEIASIVMQSPNFNSSDKMKFCRHIEVSTFGESRNFVLQSLVSMASDSSDKDLYEYAVEHLEKGIFFDIKAITGNVLMAMGHYDRIWAAVKDLHREDEVSEGFMSFLKFFGEDEDDSDWNILMSKNWYERYTKS
jgi:hypothetical protein